MGIMWAMAGIIAVVVLYAVTSAFVRRDDPPYRDHRFDGWREEDLWR